MLDYTSIALINQCKKDIASLKEIISFLQENIESLKLEIEELKKQNRTC